MYLRNNGPNHTSSCCCPLDLIDGVWEEAFTKTTTHPAKTISKSRAEKKNLFSPKSYKFVYYAIDFCILWMRNDVCARPRKRVWCSNIRDRNGECFMHCDGHCSKSTLIFCTYLFCCYLSHPAFCSLSCFHCPFCLVCACDFIVVNSFRFFSFWRWSFAIKFFLSYIFRTFYHYFFSFLRSFDVGFFPLFHLIRCPFRLNNYETTSEKYDDGIVEHPLILSRKHALTFISHFQVYEQ